MKKINKGSKLVGSLNIVDSFIDEDYLSNFYVSITVFYAPYTTKERYANSLGEYTQYGVIENNVLENYFYKEYKIKYPEGTNADNHIERFEVIFEQIMSQFMNDYPSANKEEFRRLFNDMRLKFEPQYMNEPPNLYSKNLFYDNMLQGNIFDGTEDYVIDIYKWNNFNFENELYNLNLFEGTTTTNQGGI